MNLHFYVGRRAHNCHVTRQRNLAVSGDGVVRLKLTLNVGQLANNFYQIDVHYLIF